LQQSFLTRDDYDRFEGLQDQLKDRILGMEEKFGGEVEAFQHRADQIVEQTIELQMDEKFEKYEKVRLGFSMFFDQQDFMTMLARKADVEVVLKIT
jgi:transcriptional regulator of heat shock response